MAVWENSKPIVIGLSVLLAAQFGIVFRCITTVRGGYVDGSGCVAVSVEANIFVALYIATIIVDFVIIVLIAYKTYVNYQSMYHSGLIKLIFQDGLVYFAAV